MPSCSALSCTNTSEKGYRLFKFPSNYKRCKMWIENCCNGAHWRPNLFSKLCEVHFDDYQWEQNRVDGWLKLKPNAVPTLFDLSGQSTSLFGPINKPIITSETVNMRPISPITIERLKESYPVVEQKERKRKRKKGSVGYRPKRRKKDPTITAIMQYQKKRKAAILNDHTYAIPCVVPFDVTRPTCTDVIDLSDECDISIDSLVKVKMEVDDLELKNPTIKKEPIILPDEPESNLELEEIHIKTETIYPEEDNQMSGSCIEEFASEIINENETNTEENQASMKENNTNNETNDKENETNNEEKETNDENETNDDGNETNDEGNLTNDENETNDEGNVTNDGGNETIDEGNKINNEENKTDNEENETDMQKEKEIDIEGNEDIMSIKKIKIEGYPVSNEGNKSIIIDDDDCNEEEEDEAEEICILCATKRKSENKYTSILEYSAMINDLTGINILNSKTSVMACEDCYKNLLLIWNFKHQIIKATAALRQMETSPVPVSTSKIVSDSILFQYIECQEQNADKTNEEQEEVITLASILETPMNKDKKIRLVPIQNILENPITESDKNKINADQQETATCNSNIFLHHTEEKLPSQISKVRSQDASFECHICKKSYLSCSSLERHEKIHEAKRYLCYICGDAYHVKQELRIHLLQHLGIKVFTCAICDKQFSSSEIYRRHRSRHKIKNNPPKNRFSSKDKPFI